MKRFLFLISLFCLCSAMQAQVRKHTTFYDQRATLFETLPTRNAASHPLKQSNFPIIYVVKIGGKTTVFNTYYKGNLTIS